MSESIRQTFFADNFHQRSSVFLHFCPGNPAMKSFVQFILIGVVLLAIVGFSRQWFAVVTTNRPEEGKVDLHLEVNKQKIQEDARQARTALQSAADRTIRRNSANQQPQDDQLSRGWPDDQSDVELPRASAKPGSTVRDGFRNGNDQWSAPQNNDSNSDGDAPLFVPPTRRTAQQENDLLDAAKPQ